MPLKLVRVESDDEFEELVRCEFAAFETPRIKLLDLYFPRLNGREAAIQSAVKLQAAWHRAAPTSTWLKVIDTENHDQVVGGACWHVYETDPYAVASEVDCNWFPTGEEREIANHLYNKQISGPRMTYMRKPHVWLNNCFTHPDARRRGVGRLLMDWGIQQADERSYETYVDASDLGRNLYRAYGFISADEQEQLDLSHFKNSEAKRKMQELVMPFEWWPMHRPVGGKYEPGKGLLPWEKQ